MRFYHGVAAGKIRVRAILRPLQGVRHEREEVLSSAARHQIPSS